MARWVEATTVGDLFARAVTEAATAEIVFPDRRVTYRELADVANHYARALTGLGIEQGDRVGILLPNDTDYVGCFLGAEYLGAVPVLINARFKGSELSMVIPHADIKVLVSCRAHRGSPDYAELVARALPSLAGRDPAGATLPEAPELRYAVCLHGEHPGFLTRDSLDLAADRVGQDRVEHQRGFVRVRDPGLVMYTSGTTAEPKGCLISHEALTRQALNYVERFGLTADDRFWDPLPFYHIGGIVPLLGCFAARCTYCHAGQFEPGAALRMLEQERCTVGMPVFETIWQDVLNHPWFADTDLSSLRTVLNIGVPERLRDMQARMPGIVQVSGSGATEYTGNLALGAYDDPFEARLTTAGPLMPGAQARIVDIETGADCPPGAEGELLYRGCGLFDGYYKEPEVTAQLIDSEGWFHSGDLASLDAQGRLVWVGRLGDMLKVGGENVAAAEVEDVLASHPAVHVVQVVGLPDGRYGEVPVAFVERRTGEQVSEQELVSLCSGTIASFKVPRHVRFVTEWPMSGTKIMKHTLREWIAAELGSRTGSNNAER